jgi:hypothetical protein
LTLRQAAVIAGLGYLFMPVAFAEFNVFPKLIQPGNIEQTVQNIVAHSGLFLTAIFCYLITFISDIVISWALYVLLAPVNRSLSLLAAWFRLAYTIIAFVASLRLVTVFRILRAPDYLALFGSGPLQGQVKLLLDGFRFEWSAGFLLFDIHLVLLGALIYRSGYIPRLIGVLLVIDGLGWLADNLRPYLYPNAHLGFLFVTFFGELVFMLWLLALGWRIKEPGAAQAAGSI